MMDWTWSEVAKIAGGGFGITILVLIILSVVIWIVGLVIQRIQTGGEETK
jgi:Na+-transporting methylmalonyl-CoA/oxaloacetate decarboxylase gamma subunit